MNIEIVGRNYKVSDHLEEITEQKLAKLDKYFKDSDTFAKVSFKKVNNSYTTEVMLEYNTKFVRATATGDNPYINLDIVLPKLEGQIRKYRTRFDKAHKNSAFKEISLYENEFQNNNTSDKIVKEKKFKLVPMTVNEAVEEMELLGHSFYVFLEAKTNSVQVLYRRNDGDLGLIEPNV